MLLPVAEVATGLAGVNREALVGDELDLPAKLPDTINHADIKRRYTPRRKQR